MKSADQKNSSRNGDGANPDCALLFHYLYSDLIMTVTLQFIDRQPTGQVVWHERRVLDAFIGAES